MALFMVNFLLSELERSMVWRTALPTSLTTLQHILYMGFHDVSEGVVSVV